MVVWIPYSAFNSSLIHINLYYNLYLFYIHILAVRESYLMGVFNIEHEHTLLTFSRWTERNFII